MKAINTGNMRGKFTGTVEYLRSLGYEKLPELNLPAVEIKADKVSNPSSLKKFAIGAALVLALGYFVYKW